MLIQYSPQVKNISNLFSKYEDFGFATGFFVRVKGHLFLISNYHVFTGVDGYKNKREDFQFANLKIRYYDRQNNAHYLHISIGSIEAASRIISFAEYPDIYVFELKEIDFDIGAKIYSLENYVFSKNKTGDCYRTAFSYQYPLNQSEDMNLQIKQILFANESQLIPVFFGTATFNSGININGLIAPPEPEKSINTILQNSPPFQKEINNGLIVSENVLGIFTSHTPGISTLDNSPSWLRGNSSLFQISSPVSISIWDSSQWLTASQLKAGILAGRLDSMLSIAISNPNWDRSIFGTDIGPGATLFAPGSNPDSLINLTISGPLWILRPIALGISQFPINNYTVNPSSFALSSIQATPVTNIIFQLALSSPQPGFIPS